MIWIGAQTNKHTLGLCLDNHLRSFLLSKDKWCWPDREYIGTRLSDLASALTSIISLITARAGCEQQIQTQIWISTNTNTNMDKHKYKYKYGWIQIQIQAVPQVWSLPWPFVLVVGQTACSPISFTWNKVAPWSSARHELQTPCMLLASNHALFVCLFVWPGCEWDLGFLADGRGSDRGRVANTANLHVTPYSLYTPRTPWTCL